MRDDELDVLAPLADRFGVSVTTHESLLEPLVASTPPGAKLDEWLAEQLPAVFPSGPQRPMWLQESEWPVREGQPLVFVGQIDVEPSSSLRFHDTTGFYVFYDPSTGEVEAIIQQA